MSTSDGSADNARPSTLAGNDAGPAPKKGKKDRRSDAEKAGASLAIKLYNLIKRQQGVFLRDEDGSLHVVVEGRRIPLKYDRDSSLLASLMLEACGVSTLSMAAQVALQRLRVDALKEAGRMRFKRFSALSDDGQRLYIPLADGQLLKIAPHSITPVANGTNVDSIWLEHPYDDPLQMTPAPTLNGLEHFERLLVDTQACQVPEMKWFVAMHEGLFPFIRDASPARLVVVHIGSTQQGKTTGAQRFTLLHGLGDVKGDYSVAALNNMGDIGLLVMDNKEQANFTQQLIDFLLFLATGAERGRSREDGSMRVSRSRPVGVITSIEGVFKAEVQARCVDVSYAVPGGALSRAAIEREIRKRRHEITAALTQVLKWYMEIKDQPLVGGCPIPEFEEHYTALANLLRAYGEVADKPKGWSESVITAWGKALANCEPQEDNLEYLIFRILFGSPGEILDTRLTPKEVTHQDKKGTLYVTECGHLLAMLQEQNPRDQHLPRTPNALGRRLRSAKFHAFTVLDEESAPGVEVLKRTAKSRPIGIFVQDDE